MINLNGLPSKQSNMMFYNLPAPGFGIFGVEISLKATTWKAKIIILKWSYS
jgi:hypothetical protein